MSEGDANNDIVTKGLVKMVLSAKSILDTPGKNLPGYDLQKLPESLLVVDTIEKYATAVGKKVDELYLTNPEAKE